MQAHFNIPQLLRRRRKEGIEIVEFVPVREAFTPQVGITMLQDVSGWVNNDKKTGKKWHLNMGKTYYVDKETADRYILKGYAKGDLSRVYSDDEIAEIRSTTVTMNIGGVPRG